MPEGENDYAQRTHRAVVQTHDFLVELSRETSQPERGRRDARFLRPHYPSRSNMLLAGRPRVELKIYALANTLSKL